MAKPKPTHDTWYSTPAEARRRKPLELTLSDDARAALVAASERAGVVRSRYADALFRWADSTGFTPPGIDAEDELEKHVEKKLRTEG